MGDYKPRRYQTLSEHDAIASDMESRCQAVVNSVKCKHGMLFEYCGYCQRVDGVKDTKFPIDAKDANGVAKLDANGNPRKIWIPTQAKTVDYRRYR